MSEAEAVRTAAGLPDDAQSSARADAALGDALVSIVQTYLARVSDEWDVDLFFETYGRPPRDGSSWSKAIIDGINSRTDLPKADRQTLIDDSRQKAVELLAAGYPDH